MAEFYESSLWMKLVMMLVSAAFSMHLFSMDVPGWSMYQDSVCTGSGVSVCVGNLNAVRAVQALEVIGFLSVLIALLLSLSLVLIDEIKGSKMTLVCLFIFSLIAGVTIIVGIAVFEGMTNVYLGGGINGDGTEYASTIGVMAGVCALLAAVFCILQLMGVYVTYDDRHRNVRDLAVRDMVREHVRERTSTGTNP